MYECAKCGAVFGGLTLFDAHQDVDYSREPVIICRDPSRMVYKGSALKLNKHDKWVSAIDRPAFYL